MLNQIDLKTPFTLLKNMSLSKQISLDVSASPLRQRKASFKGINQNRYAGSLIMMYYNFLVAFKVNSRAIKITMFFH